MIHLFVYEPVKKRMVIKKSIRNEYNLNEDGKKSTNNTEKICYFNLDIVQTAALLMTLQ
jgi:hypothetical protein